MRYLFYFVHKTLYRYPYISRLICNAGVASFSAIDWAACFKQLLKEPMNALTAPTFYIQHQGEISIDNLGWVWQCNLFGHYVLVSSFLPQHASRRYTYPHNPSTARSSTTSLPPRTPWAHALCGCLPSRRPPSFTTPRTGSSKRRNTRTRARNIRSIL